MVQKIAGSIPVIGILHGYSFGYIEKLDYVIAVSKNIQAQLINHYIKVRSCKVLLVSSIICK